MQTGRRSADSVLYEPAELYGQPILGTGHLIDHDTGPDRVFCYDYLHIADRYLITSEKDSQFAEGTVLLQRPLVFDKSGTLDASLIDHDKFLEERMVTPQDIKEFFHSHAQASDSIAPLPGITQL